MNNSNIIALIWDFDKTLIPGNMQEPLFRKYNVNPSTFWDEVDNLSNFYKKQHININQESIYLNHILTYVKEGIFDGLNNSTLEQLGKELRFNPGLPDFFQYTKTQIYQEFGNSIIVEHYIITNGLKTMVNGSAISPYIDGCWGSEFIEFPAPSGYLSKKQTNFAKHLTISQIGYAFDNHAKTKALFEINEGVNKGFVQNVNTPIEMKLRRIPFENMIYIADGESDIPAFSLVKSMGGSSFGVFPKNNKVAYNVLLKLNQENRIDHFDEANFEITSSSSRWLLNLIHDKAISLTKQFRNNSSRVPN